MTDIVLSKNKIYHIPSSIEIISHRGKYIILSVEEGKWIVATKEQLPIFNSLASGMSVGALIDKYIEQEATVLNFLSEIEGRHFEGVSPYGDNIVDRFALRIYLTRKCNMRCPHCFIEAGEAKEKELTYDEIISLIDKSVDNGCYKIILTGGEPLLHPRIFDIVYFAKSKYLQVDILSNGTLWTDSYIERLSKHVDHVQISIDGYDEVSNAVVRGSGNLEKALLTIENLLKNGVAVSVSVTPIPEMLEQHFSEYKRFAQSLLNKFINDRFEVSFTDELLDGRSGSIVETVKNKYAANVKRMHEELYFDYEYKVFVRKHLYNSKCVNCGFANLTIDSNGDIYYCSRLGSVMSHGNIRSKNLESVLSERLQARVATSVNSLKPCKTCKLRNVCGGGCRLSNFPKLAKLNTIDEHHVVDIQRKCTLKIYNQILDFMLDSDSDLYF